MRQVQRSSLISQVTAQLRDEITSQRWPVGTRIPTEPELCEMTGTGRNTVREAVQALVHAGMVERRQGSGTFVMTCSDLGGTLGKYFSDARHRDVTELRETLEVTAAALAADRRNDDDIRVMLGALEDRNVAWSNPTPLADAVRIDAHLHRAIVAASHNAIYLEFYDSLLPVIHDAMRHHAIEHDNDYVDEHTALVQAVIDGDAARAMLAARSLFHELAEPLARVAKLTE
ncbi:FadR family transcriptional regulator [Rhodococcus sp. ARC_M12]|uniref:FadR/GntR family transcriptional regulator n=1 Tax=Rhodococcus navarretei TaxID=3128981 RepID=A0ABU9CXQ0_9NOCA|nr:FadR/GntR family transcriptional regulator [Rhodococcus sp. ARC_M12]MCJ0976688.1 FadR family transcriptional regulator [Rhodococcus sp. ARC_M12]